MTSLTLQSVEKAIVDLMPDLCHFARALTGSADAGNELVQAAYERALSRPESLIDVKQPASWMYRVIRNLWIDEKRSSRDRLSTPLEEGENIAVEDTERALMARSTLARVRAEALFGFRGGRQQGGQEGSEQGFAPASGVVHEFEEGKIVGQLLL